MNYFQEYPNPNYNNLSHIPADIEAAVAGFELSDYLTFGDGDGDGADFDQEDSTATAASPENIAGSAAGSSDTSRNNTTTNMKYNNKNKKNTGFGNNRVAFRTKSELEIMDDGFKWRKYGKKSVKNSPNPRNYYKCSSEGCIVKKRVERDREDSSYVITTYDGIHNHETPSLLYHDQMPLMAPNALTFQTS